jgi:serine/threonine protein phosphatase PrpC
LAKRLQISLGQHSHKGRKEINQDFHGACIPEEPQLGSKGIAIALADGIGSSDVSQVASQTSVRSFLEDYYCTSEAWSVRQSVQRVLTATNFWLHSHTRQSQYSDDRDRGYVCTLSAMVIKSSVAHLFHVGDARIYRLQGKSLEQLTDDHRVWLSRHESYLGRALGADQQVEIDYKNVPLERGEVFLLATDGVYERIVPEQMVSLLEENADDLDEAARQLVATAYKNGSKDNLTAQLVRIEDLPAQDTDEFQRQAKELAIPPELESRTELDGYEIIRKLHASSRSHVYLARDTESEAFVAIKTPATELKEDPLKLETFLMEEWIAQRISSPHVLKPYRPDRKRSYIYVVTEYIEGHSLTQWMRDHPEPDIEKVRAIVEQVAKGLRAFHRQEMIHRDIRPDNILIDASGTAKIVDFGSTHVAGIAETSLRREREDLLGTEQYSAPEYFMGESGTAVSDVFSLGVVAYQMLTGKLPYGTQVSKIRSRAGRNKLQYSSVLDHNRQVPPWINAVLRKAVHPDPDKRFQDVDEFIYALRSPGKEFLTESRPPLIERNPELFWKTVCGLLTLAVLWLLALLHGS